MEQYNIQIWISDSILETEGKKYISIKNNSRTKGWNYSVTSPLEFHSELYWYLKFIYRLFYGIQFSVGNKMEVELINTKIYWLLFKAKESRLKKLAKKNKEYNLILEFRKEIPQQINFSCPALKWYQKLINFFN